MNNVISIRNETHWHEIRQNYIGGSEIAALFDDCPSYQTKFELWHIKKGNLPSAIEESERMFWGNMLESSIAKGIAKRCGWTIEPTPGYFAHPSVKGMGCTPDFFITSPVEGFNGKLCLQIKNVSYLEYRDNWLDGEPPLNYLLQLQHEIACTGAAGGVIGALIGGNESAEYFYHPHEKSIRRIEDAVTAFWRSIDANEEPKAFAEDYELIGKVRRIDAEETIDLSADNELPELCASAAILREQRIKAEKDEKAVKAEITQKLKGASRATCSGFVIEYPEITQNVTAHTRNYRKLTIKEIK